MDMSIRDAAIFIEEYIKIKKGEVNDVKCVSKKALEQSKPKCLTS